MSEPPDDVGAADNGFVNRDLLHLVDKAFKTALKVLRNEDNALEIAQTVIATLLAKGPPGPNNPEAWVTTVAKRCAIEKAKEKRRDTDYRSPLPSDREATTVRDDFTEVLETRILVEEMLKGLSPRQAQAHLLRALEIPLSEVAVMMGISRETVKKNLKRGKPTYAV